MDVSRGSPGLVEGLGQLAVGGPGGFQFVCAFVELDFQVEGRTPVVAGAISERYRHHVGQERSGRY